MDFLRSKQSGVQYDFTGTLADAPDVFALDEVAKFGLTSTVSTIAYDPVQSLLAVGTYQNSEASGEVHIFGQKRVHVTYKLLRKASVKILQLCDSKIVVLDSKNDMTIFDMEAPGVPGVGYSPPGVVTALRTDPSLDWAFLGLQTGEVIAYDLDREMLSPLRIPNFWRVRSPKARLLPVASLALHPKDVGTLLIGYSEGAVVYSFKQNAVLHHLEFHLPPGAPGADTELSMIRTHRKPNVTQALWHPTGTFICTTHEDSVMAIWNPKDGSIVQARTLEDSDVHLPGNIPGLLNSDVGGISIRQPIFKIAWCSTSNPDDTSLLIAGGNPMTMAAKGMTLIDLGPSPNMLTSSAQVVADHFSSPRRQRILPTPTDHDVVDFCLIPKSSPHYGGSHDPIAVVGLLASGELVVLRFPDGQPLSPASLLNPSLALAHPFATRVDVSAVNRQRWLSMVKPRKGVRDIVVGGIEHVKPLRRYENRTVVQSSHSNGTVRIWDMGHADEIENDTVIEIDVGRVLQRGTDLKIECVSMAGSTAETAVGMETGEVVVFRWGGNTAFGRTTEDEELMVRAKPAGLEGPIEGIRDVRMRADPEIKEGLLPVCVLAQNCGSVITLRMSDVGFCAVAYQTGHLCVLDMRGPAVIYHESFSSITSKESKRASFRKSNQPTATEKATCLEFGVLTLDGEEFSSVSLFVGTSAGRVLTFKLLPSQSGTFTCIQAGTSTLSSTAVISITPLNSDTGDLTLATPSAVASLRDGFKTPGVLVCVSKFDVHVFRPPHARGAHKSLSESDSAASAAVCNLQDYGTCLTVALDSRTLTSFSLPGLKSIATLPVSSFFTEPPYAVLHSGHIFGRTGEHQIGLAYQWGRGITIDSTSQDALFNPAAIPTQRPTISNLQWLAGTQHVGIADLDLLVGGPGRPMSEKMLRQQREMANAEREALRRSNTASSATESMGGGEGGGMFANMAKNMRERTEKLSFTTDTMERLEETSASFADDVSKYVSQQKRKALLGGITGKWF